MAYKIRYEPEADVISLYLSEKGKLAYAEEMEDVIVHADEYGKPLYIEVLHASKMLRPKKSFGENV